MCIAKEEWAGTFGDLQGGQYVWSRVSKRQGQRADGALQTP